MANNAVPDQTASLGYFLDNRVWYYLREIIWMERQSPFSAENIFSNVINHIILFLLPLSFWNGLFHPLIWTSIDEYRGFSLKRKTEQQTEKILGLLCTEPSHLDLHSLHRYLFWFAWAERVKIQQIKFVCVFLFLGLVVQSIVSLTSSLRVISLTVLADSIYNILICKSYSHFFSKKFQNICISLDVNFNKSLTNDVVSFERPGPVFYFSYLVCVFVLFFGGFVLFFCFCFVDVVVFIVVVVAFLFCMII